jgi:ribosome-binding protein aMBF1 (putative translation factor)
MNLKMSIITSDQVRAAKALLRWSGEDLAQKSGISLSSIRRVESADSVPEAQNLKTLLAIKTALENGGVEFIGTPEDRPGVRLAPPRKAS